MLMMLMEESQSVFEKFRKETVQALEKFKARDEEAEITYGELKEAWDIFEYSVIQQGYDQLSQRIPAEKFIRYSLYSHKSYKFCDYLGLWMKYKEYQQASSRNYYCTPTVKEWLIQNSKQFTHRKYFCRKIYMLWILIS